ncbi:MAG: aminopeptidase [Candidatus Omnitrophota bacterium]|nr:aminopeptidase [Candidatus Omnitrophota bacterium]
MSWSENLFLNVLKAAAPTAFIYEKDFSPFVKDITSLCEQNKIPLDCILVDFDGITLSPKIAEVLLNDKHKIILFGLKENVWHFPERQQAKSKLKKKLISLACYYDRITEEGDYDNSIIKALANDLALARLFEKGKKVTIASPSGTKIKAEIGERSFFENGDYSKCGSGGDFPSGEVGFGPKENSVNGLIVFDLKIQHIGTVSNLKVEVEQDKIVTIEGEKKEAYEKLLKKHDILNLISEISIGINPFIRIKNEPSVLEEKKLGTVHFGHGANLSYGKRKGLHFDAVIRDPTFTIEDKIILKRGGINKIILSEETKSLLEKVDES